MIRLFALCAALAPCLMAQQPVAPHPDGTPAPAGESQRGAPNDWMDQTFLDLGVYYEEEEAVGTFSFHNPRDEPHAISHLRPSCTCSKALVKVGDRRYEVGADKQTYRISIKDGVETKEQVTHINVGPHEEGTIEVHMHIAGIRGPKEASLTYETDDEAQPLVNVSWRATGATFFVVEPPEVNLNEMTWTDQRDFQFRITSPMKKDFELTSHDPLPEAMKISYEKEMQGDQAVWTVKGTYGPGASEQDGGGTITFHTDVDDKTVSARVIAFLKGPLTVQPGGFVSLGHIEPGESKEVEVRLIPTGDFDLQVESLEPVRLRGAEGPQRDFIHFDHHKDGKDEVVTIRVDPGMNKTYIHGILRVHTNHPAAPSKDIMFNGFVR